MGDFYAYTWWCPLKQQHKNSSASIPCFCSTTRPERFCPSWHSSRSVKSKRSYADTLIFIPAWSNAGLVQSPERLSLPAAAAAATSTTAATAAAAAATAFNPNYGHEDQENHMLNEYKVLLEDAEPVVEKLALVCPGASVL